MSLPTTPVIAQFADASGRPLEGATVSLFLTGPALDGDAYVTGRRHYARTNEAGRVLFDVWPNNRGDRPTAYAVTIRDASGRLWMRGSASIPSSDEPVNLLTILEVHP